jgi:hypothetical protein
MYKYRTPHTQQTVRDWNDEEMIEIFGRQPRPDHAYRLRDTHERAQKHYNSRGIKITQQRKAARRLKYAPVPGELDD